MCGYSSTGVQGRIPRVQQTVRVSLESCSCVSETAHTANVMKNIHKRQRTLELVGALVRCARGKGEMRLN